MIGFLNWGGECLLRGKRWVFILDRMRFVFKGLNFFPQLSNTYKELCTAILFVHKKYVA
jgi:hypothetical protein